MNGESLKAFGPNAGYLTELYQLYLSDAGLVDPTWAEFFRAMDASNGGASPGTNGAATLNGTVSHAAAPTTMNGAAAHAPQSPAAAQSVANNAAADRLCDAYRRFAHFEARWNPLSSTAFVPTSRSNETHRLPELALASYGVSGDGRDAALSRYSFAGSDVESCAHLAIALEKVYCGSIGFEYMHITSAEEREWLRSRIESRFASAPIEKSRQERILRKLVQGDLFESELHRTYVGTKRFSLEGNETLIPVLDSVLGACAQSGVHEVVFGMAHRGRLNVLANTLGKPLEAIFAEFEDQSMATVVGSGDVKYHLGFKGAFVDEQGTKVALQMVPNPSHLEFVNPVVEGVARAIQDGSYGRDRKSVLPIAMHGDAAFAGQGVVFETLNYSRIEGYSTGGTVHIVINNQIGFTTTPDESRSTPYCTDMAKGLDCPIFHVNGEDPEASCWIALLALEYRNRFAKDVFIDLIGYRRHGHNEGDDPSFTQPLIYQEIKSKSPVWKIYGEKLAASGAFDMDAIEAVTKEYRESFAAARTRVAPAAQGDACAIHGRLRIPTPDTGVDAETLRGIARSLVTFPEGFVPHPKLAKIIEKRVETVEKGEAIEWGVAEALAFGSLVSEGKFVRLSGQDCGRGTFSQRHLVLDHYEAPATFSPLALLPGSGKFEVYNSSLSEAGVLGFEFGYAATRNDALVMWEGQFGDFANGAQVIIDQFIASSEAKWGQLSGVTMLLPHAYEGQGPEHSSARLERFLQLCGEGNMCVCYPSTSAQHFHLLRRQGLLDLKRPLIVMTPKSLLRLPGAASSLDELTTGAFKTVIETDLSEGGDVEHVVLLTGKVFHDVYGALKPLGKIPVKIVRVEQLHPFPQFEFKKVLKNVSSKRVLWVQEEPQNMGAWSYVQPYLSGKLDLEPVYVGRDAAASTATGSPKRHASEQKGILDRVRELLGV